MSTDVAAIQSNFLYNFSIIAMPNGYNGTSKILEIHSIKQPLQLEMKVKYHTVQSKVLTNSCFYKLLISLPHRLHFPHFFICIQQATVACTISNNRWAQQNQPIHKVDVILQSLPT